MTALRRKQSVAHSGWMAVTGQERPGLTDAYRATWRSMKVISRVRRGRTTAPARRSLDWGKQQIAALESVDG